MNQPIISVVIPAFNREDTLSRAIESVITQNCPSVEIIVVDDASNDGTYMVAHNYLQKTNLKIIRHEINQGVGPSRNSGIATANGEWVLPLDSDDELVPGVLEKLLAILINLDEDIKRIRGMNIKIDGSSFSKPNLPNEVWNYEKYIKLFSKSCELPIESSSIYKKSALLQVPFKSGRSTETLFHLDFFRSFKVLSSDIVFIIYHSDAKNNTRKPQSVENILRNASDMAAMIDKIIEDHGTHLMEWAPSFYYQKVHSGVKFHMLSGNREQAYRLFKLGLRRPTVRLLGYFVVGLISPKLLALINSKFTALVATHISFRGNK
jgi:glycosyltransferase involved in cell wall biosynthesis